MTESPVSSVLKACEPYTGSDRVHRVRVRFLAENLSDNGDFPLVVDVPKVSGSFDLSIIAARRRLAERLNHLARHLEFENRRHLSVLEESTEPS